LTESEVPTKVSLPKGGAMKTVAFVLLLSGVVAFAEDTAPKTASAQRDQCEHYITRPTSNPPIQWGNICEAYTRGVKDEMDGELQWMDAAHKTVVIGKWQDGVTVDQLIRVFMGFIDKNPAQLNKPARDVIRQSAEAANIYLYSPVP
jgi:hypothetical protein